MSVYIKKFLLILIILTISYLLYMGLYLKGYFNLDEIYIGDIKVDIPKNMHLLTKKIENKTILDNPLLPLIEKNHYTLPIKKEMSFIFTSLSKNKKPNILAFSIIPTEKIDVSKYKEIEKCFIYNYKDDYIYISNIYRKDKKIKIKVSSDDKTALIQATNNFCK